MATSSPPRCGSSALGTLSLVLGLRHCVLMVQRQTYQEQEDTVPALLVALCCFLLAALFHADFDRFSTSSG